MNTDDEMALMRVDRMTRERVIPAIYSEIHELQVTAWEAPDEPVPFTDAVRQEFIPFLPGTQWGRPWGTTWLHITGHTPPSQVPGDCALEVLVDLGFTTATPGFQAEGLVFDATGKIIKALEPFNSYVPLRLGPGAPIDIYVEAASNPDVGKGFVHFTPSPLGRKATAPAAPLYTFQRADLALRHLATWELHQDILTVRGLADEAPTDSPLRAQAIHTLDQLPNIIDPDSVYATVPMARAALQVLLDRPAARSAHEVSAIGHAHIDSAWLWPVRETIRKCARTFSNALDLMDHDNDFVFTASSAQQYKWIRDFYPDLFARIKIRVKEGRFIPAGGMWVESDTNMPGGEALVRQFVEGKGFFLREFDYECRDVWLPDSFGYTAAFPQIIRAAGSDSFLTQKLSWNETNQLPNHTFDWEGIDGTRVFTHFPPVDTYNSVLSQKELHHAERTSTDKAGSNASIVPFGFGDGGGGPTREMMAAARRAKSLEGSPKVHVEAPSSFFAKAKREIPQPPVWVGEMYLEFHRGTLTSQARTKRGNRRSEHLLHECELLCTMATVNAGAEYPAAELRALWQKVLLLQFHDILPGSSIGWVHDEAESDYRDIAIRAESLIEAALATLTDGGGSSWFNASPMPQYGIPAMGADAQVHEGEVRVRQSDSQITLENDFLRVVFDAHGLVASLIDLASGREVIPPNSRSGSLEVYRDTPAQWDAWDLDKAHQSVCTVLSELQSLTVDTSSSRRAVVVAERRYGASEIRQKFILDAGMPALTMVTEVDWHERQKMLKLAFPIAIHSDRYASEVQFGHYNRPSHENTTWDSARFEAAAQRWVHLSDSEFGVGIANDSTYGHSVERISDGGRSTYSVIRESLLRAPLFPDPEADQGKHTMSTALIVGGIPEVIAEGYRINLPVREIKSTHLTPLVTIDTDSIILETVKMAEDASGDVILRLYEAHGAPAKGRLSMSFDFSSAIDTDLLERELPSSAIESSSGSINLDLCPFELRTIRLRRSA